MSVRSWAKRCNGTVGYWNCLNACPGVGVQPLRPLPLLDAVEERPLTASAFWRADPASDGTAPETCLVRWSPPGDAKRYSGAAVTS